MRFLIHRYFYLNLLTLVSVLAYMGRQVINSLLHSLRNKIVKPQFYISVLIVCSASFNAIAQTQTYNSSGSFTVPAGVTSITVQLWGGGGGGSSRGGAAGGGGGGAYTTATITGLTPLSTVTINVGGGGGVGLPGSSTTVTTASATIIANGGLSTNLRNGSAGGAASAITGFVTASYAGGTGGNARANTGGGNNEGGGGGGGSALTTGSGGNGGNGTITFGAGGAGTGVGGNGADGDGNPDAVAGTAPGGGGGGRGEGASTSKPGANGRVIITWVCPATAGILSGTQSICVGNNTTFSSTLAGGNWTSGNPAIATINASTGLIAGVSDGTATMTYTIVPTGCPMRSDTRSVTVNPIPTVASPGAQTYCSGVTTTTIPLSGTPSGVVFDITGGTAIGLADQTGVTAIPSFTAIAGTATVTITPMANGCTGTPVIVVITVNPTPVVTATPGSQIICSGTASNIALTSNVPGATFTWTVVQTDVSGASDGSGATIDQILTATGATAGTATYTITPTANGCTGNPILVIITVNPVPALTATPISQTICSGTAPSIELSSNISGTTFDWTVLQSGVSGASDGTGATIDQALTATGSAAGTATYTATPAASSCAGTPVIVVITVNPIPVVTSTPGSQIICSGTAPSIALTSNVASTTFDWTVDQTDVSGASDGSGATIDQILTATGTTTGTATYTITLTANGCTGIPITVVVTVNPIPVATATPASQTICSGTASSLALTSNVSGSTFDWTVVQTDVTGAADGSGTGIAQTLTTIGTTVGTATYMITPTANGCAGTPITVDLTVKPTPIVTATPASQTICSGMARYVALTSDIASTTFDWTVVQSDVSGASDGSGATIDQILTATGTTTGTATYTITSTANGCAGTPIPVVVTVNPIPVATATPASQTICSVTATSITLTSNVSGSTFDWTVVQTDVTGASDGSGTAIAQTLTTTGTMTGTATYTITPTANGCSGTSISVIITVNPVPAITATPGFQTFCSGTISSIALTSNVPGTTFAWTVVQSDVLGASSGSGTTIAQALAATGNIAGTATYTVTPSVNGCDGIPETVVITVNPIPVITATPSAQTICSGTAPSIALTSNVAGTTFAWTVVQTGISGASDGSGTTIDQILTAAGTSPGNATYTITPTSNGCVGTSIIVVITVNPNPVVTATPGSQTICSGTTPAIALTSNIPGTSIAWTVGQSNVTGASSGSGTIIDQILTATGTTAGTATYTVTPTVNSCAGSSIPVIITVNPIPVIIASPSSQTICSGSNPSIGLSSNVAGSTFSWSVIQSGVSGASSGAGTLIDQILTATGTTTGTATYTISASANGCAGLTISVVISVNPIPFVTATPLSQTICSGIAPSISLTSNVSGTTFAWTVVQSGVSGASAGSGTIIDQTLSATSSTPGNATYTITPTVNGCSGSPKTVVITVNPNPVVTASPTSQTICSATSSSIMLSSDVSGTSISWSVVQSGVAGASAGSGTSISQTLSATGSTAGTATYTINSIANSCAGTPVDVVITVNPIPVITTSPSVQTICSATSPTIALTSNVAGTTFAWTVSESGVSGASAGSGATIAQSLTTTGIIAGTATYTITPTANSCIGVPKTVVITVNPLPVVTATPSSETICSGTAPSIVLTSNIAGTSFSWTVVQSGVSGASPGSGSSIAQTLSALGNVAGTATYTIIPTSNGCGGAQIIVLITVNPTPVISATPVSQIICSGTASSILLSSNISGASYAWTVAQTGVTGASAGSGATIAQILNVTGITAGTATYSITPTANGCTGTSINVLITVNPIPVATATPALQAICSGTASSIALTSSGSASTFSWTVVQSGVSGASAGTGATIAQTLSTTGSIPGTATYTITPTANGCSGLPVIVDITVNPIPIVTATPASQAICSGTASSIALSSNVAGTIFAWTVVQSGVTGALSGSGTSIVQTLTASGTAAGTATYTILATANGCTGTPETVVITVNPIPVVTATPPSQTICSGTASSVALSSNVAGTSFGWTVVQSGVSGASAGSGSALTQILTATGIIAGTATYTITPTASSCPGASINEVITVNPTPVGTATPNSQTICSGTAPSIALTSNVAGANFTWTVVQSGVSGASAGSGSTINQPLAATGVTTGTATYTITPIASGCTGLPLTLVITVNPIPVVTITPSSQSICSETTSSVALSSNVTGTSFIWTEVQSGVSGASAGSGSSITQSLTATGTSSGTATYTITPQAKGCNGIPEAVVITVHPIPVLTATPALQTICSGTAPLIALTSNVAASSFAWTVVQSGVSGAAAGSGATIAQALTATGNTVGTATYTVTPTANGCSGTPITILITVNPIPVVTATPVSQTICSGTAPSIALTSNVSGTNYSWTVVQSGISGASGGSGTPISQTLSSTGTTAGTATYTITPDANGCAGTTIPVVITVNPTPVLTANPLSQTICSGTAPSIALTSNISGTAFTWTVTESGVTGSVAGSGTTIAQSLTTTGPVPGTATYIITPTASGCAGIAKTVIITVNPIPVVTATPASQAICSATATSITLTSNVSGTTFNWTVVESGVSGASPGTGVSIAQTLSTTGNVPGIATYSITPTANSCAGTPILVVITVNPIPAVTATPSVQTICSATAPSIALTSNVSGTSFSWTVVQTGVSGASAGSGTNIAQTLTVPGTTTGTATYTITPAANGCTGAPKIVIITVNPVPVATASPSVQTICSATTTSIALTSNIAGTTFPWTVVQSGVTGAFAGSGTSIAQILSATGTIAGTATFSITPTINGCAGTPVIVVITVNPIPVVTATPSSQTICSGTAPSIALTSNVSGTTFNWTVVQSGVSGASAGSGTTISQTLSATGNNSGTATYAITPTANGCVGIPVTVPILVNPIPVALATPSAQSVCSGSSTSIALSSNISGTTYAWTVAVAPAGSITGTANGTGNAISQTLVNSTALQATATYTIIPTANGCAGIPITVVVTVNPTPLLSSPLSSSVCTNTLFTYIPTSNTPSTSFSWTRAAVLGISNPAGSGAGNVNETLINITAFVRNVTYVYTLTANGCTKIQNVTVTVYPRPTLISSLTPPAVCSDAPFNYTPFSSVAGTAFTWTRATVAGISNVAGAGSGNISETLSNTTISDVSVPYIITLTADGCTNTATVIATIKPKPVLSSSLTPPAICSNSVFSYNPTSNTAGTSFSWSRSPVAGISNGPGFGTNNPNETLINITTNPVNVTYVFTLLANGCSYSQNVVVAVNPNATVDDPGDQEFCNGVATPVIPLSGPVIGTTFTWTNNNTAIGLAANGTGNIPSFVTTNSTSLPLFATITVTPSAGSCTGTPFTFIIAVNPTAMANIPANQNICNGAPSNTIIFTGTLASITWTNNHPEIGLAASGSGNIASFTGINPGLSPIIATITATPHTSISGPVCDGLPITFTITVNPTPSVNAVSNDVICSGSGYAGYAFATSASGGSPTFHWVSSSDIGFGTSGNGFVPAFTASNSGTNPVTATISVNVTMNGCTGGVINFTITVNPVSTIVQPSDQTVCNNGLTSTIHFTGNATSYSWTNDNTNIGLGGSGNGDIGAFIAINNGVSPAIANISVTPIYTNGGKTCPGTPKTFTITVNPFPTSTILGSTTVCQNASSPVITFTGANGTAPYTFTYQINGGSNQIVTTTSGNSVTVSVPTASAGTFVYKTINVASANGCSQAQNVTATVIVEAAPTATISGTTAVCQNSAAPLITFTGANGILPYTFTYQINGGANQIITTTLGSSVTLNAPTSTAGTFVYLLVSVASSTGCSQVQPGSATVTINPTPNLVINNPVAVCSPATVDITLPAVTAGSTAGLTFTYWTNAGATIVFNTPTTASAGTYYIKGLNPATGCFAIKPVVVTVNTTPTLVITNPAPICAPGTINLTLPAVTAGSTPGLTFTYWTDAAATISYPTPATAGDDTYYIKGTTATGCSDVKPVVASVYSTFGIPVFALGASSSICKGSATITYTATAINAFTLTYSLDAASLAGGNTINSNTGLVTYAPGWTGTTLITATATGCGAPASAIHSVKIDPTPTVTLVASPATSVCEGSSFTLTATSSGGTILQTYSGSSGNINQNIADNSNAAYAYPTIPISGSGGATLASTDVVMVTLNINHNNDADLDIFLVDPSGTRAMLLSSDNGGTGNNYTNTVLRTDAANVIGSAGNNTAAFTSTYRPEGTITTVPDRTGASGAGNYNLVVPALALDGAPIDGSWSLRVFDDNGGTSGTIVNWSLSVIEQIGSGYTAVVNGPQTIGTVAYSGANNSVATVVVTPPAGTQIYTVTSTDANGCSATSNSVSVVVKPAPIPVITADYCTYRPKVRLTTPTCASCTYTWSTGATTNTIDVDIAGNYTVNVTYANGCSASGTIKVADELVTDGSFTNFNAASPSFFTEYTQQQSYYTGVGTSGLWPEGDYAVNTSAWSNYPAAPQGYHPNFHGRDHTNNSSGARNFMMVNGSTSLIGSPARQRIIWQQTVTVDSNTDYYFSAWAMNLNPASPAQLQFEVNGVLVGSVADLNAAQKPTTEAAVGLGNWMRFYSTPMWNSGASTTAVIRIRNLNTVAGGNDFGIDDISFGTLANIPFTATAASNSPAASPICSRGTLQLTSTITGGKPPIVYTWTGPNGFLSHAANPTIPNIPSNGGGTYTLSVVDWYNCPGVIATTDVVLKSTPEIPDQTTAICSGSQFNATPVNGVPAASTIVPAGTTFSWPAPTISPAGSVTGTSANSGQTLISQTLTNTTNSVATVTYTVTPVSTSCTGSTFKVIVTVNPNATADAGVAQQVCAGSTVTLNGSIGGAASTGNWTGGTGTFAPNRNTLNAVYTPSAAEISAGTVTLTLNSNDPDGAGPCLAATSNLVITINSLPVLTSTRVNVLCKGTSTGSIDLSVSGGIPAYTYTWSGSGGGVVPLGQTNNQDLTGLVVGTYSVLVRDSKTCAATTSISLTEPTLLVASESHTTVPCSIGATSVTISASGGMGPYSGTGIFAQFAGTTIYTVTDANGCTATVAATVVADPNTAPVITTCPTTRNINGCTTASISGPSFSSSVANSSYLEFSDANNNGVATDNCAITTVTYQDVSASSCPVIVTRTWTLGDAAGLTTTCQQIIRISDVTAPIWTTATGALNRSVECSDAAGLAAANALFPTAADACDADVTNIIKTSSAFVASPLCSQKGSYTNTWRVTDDCGNTSAVYTQVITITDNTAPTWTTAAGTLDRTLDCSDVVGLTAAQALKPVGADLCDGNVNNIVKVTGLFVPSGACGRQGTYTNTWTVTDDCGNVSAVFTQRITITDNSAPVWLTAPGSLDRSVACNDASGLAGAQALFPVAWDNCTNNVTNIIKTSGGFVPSSGCISEGTYTNSWTVTDDCGNTSAVYTQVISIVNNTVPMILCPPSDAFSCDSPSFDPSVTGVAVAASDCDPNPALTWSDVIVPGSCAGNYQINRTWIATDICGKSNSCTQTIFVQDVTPPVISSSVSGNQNIYPYPAGAYIQPDISWDATATDNCSGVTLSVILSGATNSGPFTTLNGKSFNEGLTLVTWTATDGCGIDAEYQFTVTVAFGPEISCPADITVNDDPNVCSATLNPGFPTRIIGTMPIIYSWVMSGATIGSGTGPIGNYNFNGGLTSITWTATNVAGSAVCTQIITVVDNQPPTFSIPADRNYCVREITSANYYDPTTDITPDRPEYYLFEPGNTELDLDPATFSDNCSAVNDIVIHWRIDFAATTPAPAVPSLTGTGQLSAYGSPIMFLGDATNQNDVAHTITYWITDQSGNESTHKSTTLVVKPRPNVIKQNY